MEPILQIGKDHDLVFPAQFLRAIDLVLQLGEIRHRNRRTGRHRIRKWGTVFDSVEAAHQCQDR